MAVLVLEDDHARISKFRRWLVGSQVHYAETAADALRLMQAGEYDAIFLDHDLGGETLVDPSHSNTGSAVARFMASPECRLPRTIEVVIHSLNPSASEGMENTLRAAGYADVERIPFLALAERFRS